MMLHLTNPNHWVFKSARNIWGPFSGTPCPHSVEIYQLEELIPSAQDERVNRLRKLLNSSKVAYFEHFPSLFQSNSLLPLVRIIFDAQADEMTRKLSALIVKNALKMDRMKTGLWNQFPLEIRTTIKSEVR